ncbi:MAG: polyprenyl synthetase family protein [Roseofilum sp. SBFL]|uniref:polyprenyl synthetase family protein n=1 Tax=unclassified Roseofilum TaxID=2620099 RepID=UPI001B171713|nr:MULTISPECIES: polyprenyl synthetase family protein [unclassified Roseofilum]MBP0015631.1 polyprenyl synthetase family protein [Roseofilum sp. SID3]MBP0022486.1 polyprenyl synthetase family protein [Roseofilum sp. SID2]MBP0039140.1 polyprenyl synthetase family protein [Roseofilum sp. SID1]MBP0042781.1 polyprenyl synthetase family protein [Roseofilum sp. SBFL]
MSKYFEMMTEISQETDAIIKHYTDHLNEEVKQLPMKRYGHPRLRDLQIRTGYEINGGKNWKELTPVCASFEILNCSTYVINWFLDEKHGYETSESKRNLVIAGFQLREIAQQILEDYGMTALIPLLSKINHQIYLGQRMDIQELKVSRIGEYPEYNEFLDAYQQRCRLLSGVFYGSCFLAGSIVAGEPDHLLYEMGAIYGSATQAANDFGDFALPVQCLSKLEKPYQDQFSDFINGKLTLAVYLMTQRSNAQECNRLEELRYKGIEENEYREILCLLVNKGVYADCLAYLKQEHKRCKNMLYTKEKTVHRDMIASILVRITSNKFLSQLRKNLELFQVDHGATLTTSV